MGEEDPSELFESYLELLINLNNTSLKQAIFEFIWQNFNDILDVIFYLKSPSISVLYLKVCHLYQLRIEIPGMFHHIFKKEWHVIDDSISKEDYIVLLWFAFLYELDEKIIEHSSESLQWFDESIPEMSLYFYLYDSMNKRVIPSHENYQNHKRKFMSGTILSDSEKEQIVTKVDTMMDPFLMSKQEEPKLENTAAEDTLKEERASNNEWTVAERVENSLDLIESYFQEKRYHDIKGILTELYTGPHHFGKKDKDRLFAFIEQLFNLNDDDDGLELDHLYKWVISMIKVLDNYEAEMFLHQNHEIIIDRVLDLNDPALISELAVTFYQYSLTSILVHYLNKVIDQWPFIDANIDERSFMRLFWIVFNQGFENRLIKVLEESASFFKQDLLEAEIYTVYQDTKLEPIKKRSLIEGLKRKVNYFDENETKTIFHTLDKRIKKMMMKSSTNKIRNEKSTNKITGNGNSISSEKRKMMHVVKLPNENPVIPGAKNTLTEEWIELAYFADVFLNGRPNYIAVKVLSQNRTGKAYVTTSLLQGIKSKIGRKKFIDVQSYEEKGNSIEDQSFSWPSTEIKGDGASDSNENNLLNEESDLKKTGYQITGLTREKRWMVLEKAVEQLGLKKVAFTIAQHAKLRKGQKNGEKKFSYAISEWEYDLAKLKKHYYKKDFTWPSTNVKK